MPQRQTFTAEGHYSLLWPVNTTLMKSLRGYLQPDTHKVCFDPRPQLDEVTEFVSLLFLPRSRDPNHCDLQFLRPARHKPVAVYTTVVYGGRTHATIIVPDISTPRNGHPATGYMNGRVTKALM